VHPKLRPVETHWIEHGGQPALLLRDRLGLSEQAVVVPRPLVPLLMLCDGTRDVGALRAAFELRSGLNLSLSTLQRILDQLDQALLLESPRFEEAKAAALAAFRQAPARPPVLAGGSYPEEPAELKSFLDGYLEQVQLSEPIGSNGHRLPRGVICPHIDYARGAPVYAEVWQRAQAAARAADLVVIFGTDHNAGRLLTLTHQSYSTPWGILPTAGEVVDAVAEALAGEDVFATELHHQAEHSIELASIWLHHALGGAPREVVPILCGSFEPYTSGGADPAEDPVIRLCVEALREATQDRQVLVIAAADLAHVGPAFGDTMAYGPSERESLARHDEELLKAISRGSADGFFRLLQEEQDRLKVCGLPPIYMALRLLGECEGEVAAYAQCPADDHGTSLVSIAGALLY